MLNNFAIILFGFVGLGSMSFSIKPFVLKDLLCQD